MPSDRARAPSGECRTDGADVTSSPFLRRRNWFRGILRTIIGGQAWFSVPTDQARAPSREHTGWSRFIRRMILSDVNIIQIFDDVTDIVVGSRQENYDENRRVMLRLSGANPDAGRPFPGPFWDVKALKNPPPTPGLNSSLKNTPQIQKCNLEHEAGF